MSFQKTVKIGIEIPLITDRRAEIAAANMGIRKRDVFAQAVEEFCRARGFDVSPSSGEGQNYKESFTKDNTD